MAKFIKPIIALLSFYSVNWLTDILSRFVLVFYNPNFVTSILTGDYTEEQIQTINSSAVMGTTQILAAIIIIVFLFQTNILDIKNDTRTKGIQWKYTILGLSGAFLTYMAFEETAYILTAIGMNEEIMLDNTPAYYGIALSIYLAIFSPLVEECIFRGGILGNFIKEGMDKWWAIIISAAIFGAIHFDLYKFLTCFVFGIVTGWIYTRTKSLVPSMILHIMNNSMSITLCAFGYSNIYDFLLMDISLIIKISLLLILITLGAFFSYLMVKKVHVTE